MACTDDTVINEVCIALWYSLLVFVGVQEDQMQMLTLLVESFFQVLIDLHLKEISYLKNMVHLVLVWLEFKVCLHVYTVYSKLNIVWLYIQYFSVDSDSAYYTLLHRWHALGPGEYDSQATPIGSGKGGLICSKGDRFTHQKSLVPGPGSYEVYTEIIIDWTSHKMHIPPTPHTHTHQMSMIQRNTLIKGTYNVTLNNPLPPCEKKSQKPAVVLWLIVVVNSDNYVFCRGCVRVLSY